ncbi:MAG TPA: hypothetical protein PLD47_00055 [Aggregatilineales bacterium]|nr:hypothetical protein [Aggregatilineales bacterium]
MISRQRSPPVGDSMALAILTANEAAALDRTASTMIYLSGGSCLQDIAHTWSLSHLPHDVGNA